MARLLILECITFALLVALVVVLVLVPVGSVEFVSFVFLTSAVVSNIVDRWIGEVLQDSTTVPMYYCNSL